MGKQASRWLFVAVMVGVTSPAYGQGIAGTGLGPIRWTGGHPESPSSESSPRSRESGAREEAEREERARRDAERRYARDHKRRLNAIASAFEQIRPVGQIRRYTIDPARFRPSGTPFFNSSPDADAHAELVWDDLELSQPARMPLTTESAFPALFLLQAAAGLQGDDHEFLVSQAGFVMQRVPAVLQVPDSVPGKQVAEVQAFVSADQRLELRVQEFTAERRQYRQAQEQVESVKRDIASRRLEVMRLESRADTPAPTDDLLARARQLLAAAQQGLTEAQLRLETIARQEESAKERVREALRERARTVESSPRNP